MVDSYRGGVFGSGDVFIGSLFPWVLPFQTRSLSEIDNGWLLPY